MQHSPSLRTCASIASLVAVAAASVATLLACLTDPPPDLPPVDDQPSIRHTAVEPPEGTTITSLPADGFEVPINVPDPTQCEFAVFDSAFSSTTPIIECQACASGVGGGVVIQSFQLPGAYPTVCQTIRMVVAAGFSPCGTPNSTLGDTVIWQYDPPGCGVYADAGDADGAFPDVEADGLPIAPESGTE